ncbi:MAG TPA: ribosomal protein S18-alanine N-acetyltransferase [Kofleriaceae bacterium]|nr:ribosomal protein S18-alanine N-acetyltransferase [Kofleriaceae bacterium]
MTDIAPMAAGDIDAVAAIEARCYRAPWPRQVFVDELSHPWAHLDVIRAGMDAGGPPVVVAYASYWLVKDEVHLLNLAVDPAHRRRGHARALLGHVIAFAEAHRCRFVTLEVRRSNTAARSLYAGCGFVAVGVRPNYYVQDREDAVVMTLDFGQ